MDAVISIGGQSLVDGLLRILGPALEPLNAPIPVVIPGVTNALLSIRTIRAVQPSSQPRAIELELELDLNGEVLLVANVASNALTLSGDITIPAKTDAASLRQAVAVPIDFNKIDGSLRIPPTGVTAPSIPFPGVIPVPVNFTLAGPLRATLFLTPIANGGAFGTPTAITATSAFGLDFDFGKPTVQPIALPPNYNTALQSALTSALTTITSQLSLAIPGLPTPAFNPGAGAALAALIPGALQSVLATAFSGLRARTGRLTYPLPTGTPSCEVSALPTVASVQLTSPTPPATPALLLQIGVDRRTIPGAWPSFTPTATLDTGVTIDNSFLRDLLVCLIEKVPHFSLPIPAALTGTGGPNPGATWPGATIALGPIALLGTLALAITGPAGPPGGPPIAKTITLTFTAFQGFGAPLVVGSAFDVGLTVTIPIAFDLSRLASLTLLRDTAVGVPLTVFFAIGAGLNAMLIIFAILIAISPFLGPMPIAWPGLIALAFLIGALPHIVASIIRGLLTNAVNLLLSGLRLLQSPAALPPGIFEAFGELIPTSLIVDDVVAGGVLQTPTSPWAL